MAQIKSKNRSNTIFSKKDSVILGSAYQTDNSPFKFGLNWREIS